MKSIAGGRVRSGADDAWVVCLNTTAEPHEYFDHEGTDQIPDLLRDGGPSGCSVPNFPSPEQPEAFAMPGDDRLGFDDDERGPPIGPGSGQPRPEDKVRYRQLGSFLSGATEYTNLVSKRQDLHL